MKQQLTERGAVDLEERRASRNRLVDEVKAAWSEEAEAVVEHDDLELCRKVAFADAVNEDSGSAATTSEARGDVELRHRFDRAPSERSSAARVVTLRDRRRGRPRRSGSPGGSDPPG